MFLDLAALTVGLAVLVFAADRFVAGAGASARALGVPPLVVGLTVVGFGTSAPELAVSLIAALQGHAAIAIGNVIGSNIVNITLVLGLAAVLAPLTVHAGLLRRELPMVLGAGLLTLALAWDHRLSVLDGIVLLLALAALLAWLAHAARAGEDDPLAAELTAGTDDLPLPQALAWLLAGLVLLPLASQSLVWGASNIAAALGVSQLVIGLTVVAIGTSLPELATAIAAVRKSEHDLVLGNVVGSNLFNLLAVLPFPALLAPGIVPDGILQRDLPIVLVTTLLLMLFCAGRRKRINRAHGAFLLAVFVGYVLLLYFTRFQ